MTPSLSLSASTVDSSRQACSGRRLDWFDWSSTVEYPNLETHDQCTTFDRSLLFLQSDDPFQDYHHYEIPSSSSLITCSASTRREILRQCNRMSYAIHYSMPMMDAQVNLNYERKAPAQLGGKRAAHGRTSTAA
jgi:hypothetical protein